jgi:hypothetical protein
MALTSNTLGEMYALTVLAPITPGREDELREYLEGLPRPPSPLTRLPRTHFGRWVIVPGFADEDGRGSREELECQYLLFSATFDGALDSYLDELCAELAPEAERIWGCCVGCSPARGPALKAYLLHNQIPTGLFFSAYPSASVDTVKRSLEARERLIAFAVSAQQMDAAQLHREFLEEFGAA